VSLTRRFTRLTAILVMLSVGGFSAASLVTLHYHVLADGFVTVHSHPLPDDNQRNTHKHSEQQYAELDAVNRMLETMVFGPVLDSSVAEYSSDKISLEPVSRPVSMPAWHVPKRGPPSIFFS